LEKDIHYFFERYLVTRKYGQGRECISVDEFCDGKVSFKNGYPMMLIDIVFSLTKTKLKGMKEVY